MDKVQKICEEVKKLKKLADAMYYAAQYLTTDASRLHKAMNEYHQFIINECYKEEPVLEDKMTISKEWFEYCKKSWYYEGYIDGECNRDRQFEETVSEDLEKAAKAYSMFERSDDTEVGYDLNRYDGFIAGAKWGKNRAKVEIQAQSTALTHGCPKESVNGD